MLFGYTEMLCLFTNNILGVTSMITYILMLGGRRIFCILNWILFLYLKLY
jgi:hypothetical protein